MELWRIDTVLRADKPKFLSYSWKPLKKDLPDEPATVVTFEIEPKENLVKFTVTHFDFPENSKMLPLNTRGWPLVISSLKSFWKATNHWSIPLSAASHELLLLRRAEASGTREECIFN